MSIDKALTVKEPWAWAIVSAGKDVENRSRRTKYRGRLYIHAGKAWAKDAPEFIFKITGLLPIASTGHGEVLGHANVVGCHHADDCKTVAEDGSESFCSPWALADHFHWQLSNGQPIEEPFAATGKLGMWNLSRAEDGGR